MQTGDKRESLYNVSGFPALELSWRESGRRLGKVQRTFRRAFLFAKEETKMKWEIIIVALFWLVYAPFSFVLWGDGSMYLGGLVAIFSGGVVLTAAFLGGSLLVRYLLKKRLTRKQQELIKEKMATLEELEREEAFEGAEPELEENAGLSEEVLGEKTPAPPQEEPSSSAQEKYNLD